MKTFKTSIVAPANRRESLDPLRPYAFCSERERGHAGEVAPVATIFLTNRQCPWRCVYCDLWKNTLPKTVRPGAIPAQIRYALDRLAANRAGEHAPVAAAGTVLCPTDASRFAAIKLYNAGSFFDRAAIPPADFPVIAAIVRAFDRVIVECHPALIGNAAVQFRDLLRAESKSTPQLEIAMGLEIADDAILRKLNKRMTLAMFARAAEFLRNHGIAVRAFVIVKPPFVRSDADALQFARRSIDFAFDCGATAVSLIPARAGTPALEQLRSTGEFSEPKLATLEAALEYGIGTGRGRVFADLWDLEKVASCHACYPPRQQRLQRMNLEQRAWPDIRCQICAGR